MVLSFFFEKFSVCLNRWRGSSIGINIPFRPHAPRCTENRGGTVCCRSSVGANGLVRRVLGTKRDVVVRGLGIGNETNRTITYCMDCTWYKLPGVYIIIADCFSSSVLDCARTSFLAHNKNHIVGLRPKNSRLDWFSVLDTTRLVALPHLKMSM